MDNYFVNIHSEVEHLKNEKTLRQYFLGDDLIKAVFAKQKLNDNYDSVLLKVLLLDRLYGTNLKFSDNAISSMASHIVSLSQNDDLDAKIEKGDFEAVELIRMLDGRDFYSFATKYCCNSNETDSYYIYDKNVERIMYMFATENEKLFNARITHASLKEYKTYFEVCEKYKEHHCLIGTRREADWYLWGNSVLGR